MTDPNLVAHYTELCSAFRHYSNLRFAVFAVFFALQGGVVQSVITAIQAAQSFIEIASKIVGLLICLIFWFFENVIISYINFLDDQLETVEKKLGYSIYTSRGVRRSFRFIKISVATNLVYGVIAIFWLLLFFMK